MFSISSADTLSHKRAKTDALKDVKKAALEKPKTVAVQKAGKKRRTVDKYDDDETDQSIKRQGSSVKGRKKKKEMDASPPNQPKIADAFLKQPVMKVKKAQNDGK